MEKKFGFTILEMIIVLGLFSVLILVGTDFFLGVVRDSQRATIENEVRQNANSVMAPLTQSIRNAKCVQWQNVGGTITISTYSDKSCSLGSLSDAFAFSPAGIVTKNSVQINSSSVAVCSGGCGETCIAGITLNGSSGTDLPVGISISVRSAQNLVVRQELCTKVSLHDSVTPRKY